jgi:hypothetical protein
MGIFEMAALLLLAANLAVGILILRARGRPSATVRSEALDALSIRLEETAIAVERLAGSGAAAGGRPPSTEAAIAKAAGFLRRRLRAGAYGLACVGGDGAARFSDNKGHVFVAAFVAEAMTGLLDEIDRTIILTRILSEENEGRWGFSPPGPHHDERFRVFHVDSDDTAYVIRTLRGLGVNRPPDRLMSFYREAERLFVTFDAPGPAMLATEASPDHNLLAHIEVNANVFLALRGSHLERFIDRDMLRAAQDGSGFWQSYFYPSPLFGTLLALDLLDGDRASAAATARARSAIAGSQKEDGSWGADGDSHETALAVAALAGHEAHAAATRRGVGHLLAAMAEDGSWSSRACIWEFQAGSSDVWRARDTHRTYVTARCMTALRRAARLASNS